MPRKEPVEVPETVPAEPEPAPVPEKEPAPAPAPAEPVPVEPGKELIPAGVVRSEVRSAVDQIREITRSIRRDSTHATAPNLKFVLEKLSDPDGDVREAALQAIPYFVQADRGAFTAPNLKFVLEKLSDPDGDVREAALQAIPYFVSINPSLRSSFSSYRNEIEETLTSRLGFPKAIQAKDTATPLTDLITLGAKIGAGTGEKKIAPADSDPARLAAWIIQHRNGDKISELQVSIGFDTSMLPAQEHRGKFIALFLFIASTYLKDFQALVSNPKRDSNAAYGLIIRGDVVEAKLPGQVKGRRLDYIFNLSREMTEKNLSELLRQIQLLNLGLLLATAEESFQLFFPDETPAWMDARARAIAGEYRKFEHDLVKLLRDYDNLNPDQIYSIPGEDEDNRQRREEFGKYRPEEPLYSVYRWLVPLYKTDTSWQALLPVLKIAIEGRMLHQGRGARKVKDKEEVVSKGQEFIERTRQLGYDIAKGNDEKGVIGIEKLLTADSLPGSPKKIQRDPFLDSQNEEATRDYLQKTADAIEQGRLSLAELPDAETFLKALDYYNITAKRSELRSSIIFSIPSIPVRVHRETVPRKEPVEVPETVPAEPEPAPAPAVPEKEPAPPLPPEPAPAPAEPVPVEPGKELIPAAQVLPTGFKILFEISQEAIPIRYFTRFDTQFLVNLLSELLDRKVYSERAGILPETLHSALDEHLNGRVAATDAFYSWMDAQAVDSGRVLVDQGWIERLIAKSPRALYILLSALDKFQTRQGLQKPLVAVIGKEKDIYKRVYTALTNKNNDLNWEERLEAKHFLKPSRLKALVEVVSPDQVDEFIKSNNYGVAALLAGNESRSELRLAANFILSPSGVHNDDLPSVAFLILSLLEPAQLIRGIPDPHQQMLLLEASIQSILPGASRQGQVFMIQLAQYIEQVMIREHLVKAAA